MTQDPALAAATWAKELDARTGWGRLQIGAEVVSGGSRSAGAGYRASGREKKDFDGLSPEQFGIPYVFGIGVVNSRKLRAGDGLGSD